MGTFGSISQYIQSGIEFAARLISEPGDPKYVAGLMGYILYHINQYGRIPNIVVKKHLLYGSLGLIFCATLKQFVNSERPKARTFWPSIDGLLKENRATNFPSGHSYAAVVFTMFFLEYKSWLGNEVDKNAPFILTNRGMNYLIIWIASWPILRIIGRQHTVVGVVGGLLIGFATNIIYRIVENVAIPLTNDPISSPTSSLLVIE
jgi:membrane-associated phospholipid phosphatase